MHPDPHALKIYVDGSCLKNPGGPGGLAGIAEFPEEMNRKNEVLFEEGYKETTNNRMELLACIRALEYTRQNASVLRVPRVIIVTDSQYVHNVHRQAVNWKKQDWLSRDGVSIENSDLWKEFLSARSHVRVSLDIQWSKGKTTAILKEIDHLAKAAARRQLEIDRGFRGGTVARSKSKTRRASTLFPAQGQEPVINIYRKPPRKDRGQNLLRSIFRRAEGLHGKIPCIHESRNRNGLAQKPLLQSPLQQRSEAPRYRNNTR